MRWKLLLAAMPAILCCASWLEEPPPCYVLYNAKCCALGDGTPNSNSGFTPGQPTRCVNAALGSPWYCPNANGTPSWLVNEDVPRHTNCADGQTGCRTEWGVTEQKKKCKGSMYTCSTTVHGLCSVNEFVVTWDCTVEQLGGTECTVYPPD